MPHTTRTLPYEHDRYKVTVNIVRCQACNRNFEILAPSLEYMLMHDMLILCAECDVKG